MPLKDRIELVRTQPEPPNEESAKAAVILPILKELGWRSDDPARVFFEYTVGGRRVDIALKDDGRFVAFIEAKAPGKKLDAHVSQLLTYAFHEGVDIGVLTTGLEWWLYLPREKGPPPERRFATFDLASGSAEEIAAVLEKYLGRPALVDHSAERNAKEALRALQERKRLEAEIPRVWRKMIDGPDPDLISLVINRVRGQTGLDATPADVAASLGMAQPGPEPQPVPPRPPNESSEPRPKPRNPRPTAFRLWGHVSPANSYAEILVGVFAAIRTRHESEFIDTVRPLWGSYSPSVSSDPAELTRSAALEDSAWYVEVNLSAAAIKNRCRRLLEAFGHHGSDLEILFD